MRKILQHNNQNNQEGYNDPIVKLFNQIFYYFQKLTLTYFLREIFKKKNYNFKSFISLYVTLWLLIVISIIILYYKITNIIFLYILLFFLIYRVWEIVIINFWLFVFIQKATPLNKHNSQKEEKIRLLLLLSIQYFTIIIAYAGIYGIINKLKGLFFNIEINNIITLIYFSTATITTGGYGDIHPPSDNILFQAIVVSEIMVGLLFILIFLSTVLSDLKLIQKT